ncbi:hypothetical protein TNCV_789701 [Trichonephila clavipes]|nr:hypothetical protein TNCV_789701 [Trichonephila clavipes]
MCASVKGRPCSFSIDGRRRNEHLLCRQNRQSFDLFRHAPVFVLTFKTKSICIRKFSENRFCKGADGNTIAPRGETYVLNTQNIRGFINIPCYIQKGKYFTEIIHSTAVCCQYLNAKNAKISFMYGFDIGEAREAVLLYKKGFSNIEQDKVREHLCE